MFTVLFLVLLLLYFCNYQYDILMLAVVCFNNQQQTSP